MSKNVWLIQDSHLNIDKTYLEYQALSSLNTPFIPFGILPDGELTGIYDNFDKCIARSSIKTLRLAMKKNFAHMDSKISDIIHNGYDYNEINFDQNFISTLDLPLLNKDSLFLNMNDNSSLYASFSQDMFIKPSNDQKAFVATILPAGQTIKVFLEVVGCPIERLKNETLLVSKVKHLKGEYRFICIEDTIAEGSKYLEEGKLDVEGLIPDNIKSAANEYVSLFKPANIFAMDLVETDSGISIVEYNCWNCSGLYNIDRKSLFNKINEYKFS